MGSLTLLYCYILLSLWHVVEPESHPTLFFTYSLHFTTVLPSLWFLHIWLHMPSGFFFLTGNSSVHRLPFADGDNKLMSIKEGIWNSSSKCAKQGMCIFSSLSNPLSHIFHILFISTSFYCNSSLLSTFLTLTSLYLGLSKTTPTVYNPRTQVCCGGCVSAWKPWIDQVMD